MARSKKKKINSKLITILAIVAVPVLMTMLIAVDSRRPFLPGALHKMLGRDPEVLLSRGQAGLVELEKLYASLKKQAWEEATPAESAKKWKAMLKDEYSPQAKEVFQSLNDARRFGKNNIELQIRACNELARLHIISGDFLKGARDCWESIIKLDSSNYDAWKSIADMNLELAEIYTGVDILTKLTEAADELVVLKPDDAYGHSLKLLAVSLKLKSGLSDNVIADQSAAEALLATVQEKFPVDVLAAKAAGAYYSYQSQKASTLAARQEILAKSAVVLKSAIQANPDNAQAYQNYFKFYLEEGRVAFQDELKRVIDDARRTELSRQLAEFNAAAESEYNVAMLKFPDNADLKVSKANYLSSIVTDDYKEIAALYEQAVALEPDNLLWYSVLGKLYYVMSDMSADDKMLADAGRVLRRVYYGYNDQMQFSPEGRKLSVVRYVEVMPFLALLDSRLASQDKVFADELQGIAVELLENKGATSILAIACDGLQAMVAGQKEKAIQKLYTAINNKVDQSEFSAFFEAEIRWKLYELLSDSEYKLGSLQNAVTSFNMRPRSGRDFVRVLDTFLEVATGSSRQEIVKLIEMFGGRYEKDGDVYAEIRQRLAQALMSTGQVEQARKVVADIVGGGIKVEFIRCELIEDEAGRIAAMEELAKKYPADRGVVDYLYSYYLKALKSDPAYLPKVRGLIASANSADPDELFYIQELAKVNEPDPLAISNERMFELQLATINGLKDGYQQAMLTGRLYDARTRQAGDNVEQAKADSLKAIEYYEKAAVLKPETSEPLTAITVVLIGLKEYDKAQDVVDKLVKQEAMAGQLAQIDLLFAKGNLEEAQNKLVAYLAEYPLSARGHHVLARIYTQQGRRADASAELEKSLSQDRFNADAILDYMVMLNESYAEIGLENVGPDKIQNMMGLIEQLMNQSQGNIQGVQFFVRYAPLWAKVLEGQLNSPNINPANAELYRKTIGNIELMVVNNIKALTNVVKANDLVYLVCINSLGVMSDLESLQEKKQSYIDMIDEMYNKAMAEMPGSSLLVSNYEIFARQTGRSGGQGIEKLKSMLASSTGAEHYDAVMALVRLYITDDNNDAIIALLSDEIAKAEDLEPRLGMRTMLASVYKKAGQYDKAIELYTQQRKDKDSEDIMTLQIETMMDGGYAKEAEPLLAEMEAKYPEVNKVYLLKAKAALRETDYAKAIEYADKALELKPGELVGLHIKGQALFYSDKLYEAQLVINEMRASSSADSNLGRAMLAQIYSRTRKYDDAILELKKGLNSQPGDTELNAIMVNLLRNLKRWDELVAYYQKQMSIFPANNNIRANCAQAMLVWARELKAAGDAGQASSKLNDAMVLLEQAIAVAGSSGTSVAPLVDARMEIMLESGKYDDIANDIQSNSEMINSNPQLMLRKVESLYLGGKKQEALVALGQLVDKFGQDAYIEVLIEKVAGIIPSAELIAWSESNMDKSANKSVLYLFSSSAARRGGQMEQYFANAAKAVEYVGDSQTLSYVARSRFAIACIQVEKYDKAIEIYRDLCKQYPTNYSLLNNLAYALLSQGGNAEEALDAARKAYSIVRLEPMVLDTYGMALLENKQAEQAYLYFSKAIQEIQRNNTDVPVEFEYHQAQALVASERSEEAVELLTGLLERAKLSQSAEDKRMITKVEELLNNVKK